MIVLIDEEKGKVILCEQKEFDISDINTIASNIFNKEVYYVTSADIVDGKDVIDLLSQLTGISFNPFQKAKTDNLVYFHPAKNRQVIVRSKNGKEFIFRGMLDFRLVSDLPLEIIESSSMESFLASGIIEKVDSIRKQEIIKEFEEGAKKRQKIADDESILVKSSEPGSALNAANNGIGGDDIASEIAISGDPSFRAEDENENYINIKKLGL